MTATEEFVIDQVPGEPRVVFAAALLGARLQVRAADGQDPAELVLHGRAELPGGLDATTLFGLARQARSGASAIK